MKTKFLVILFLIPVMAFWALYSHAEADPIAITKTDSVESVLKRNMGKRVTIKLSSGEELTGKVKIVTGRLVHLAELSGREFFDAAININDISVVIVRTRDQ